jgi:hypothetical protein
MVARPVLKPDLSGEWTLNREASTLSPEIAPVVENGFVKFDHREPQISVHLSITMSGKPIEFRFDRVTDGREVTWESPEGPGASRTHWDGDALVFSDTTPTPNGAMTIVFRYELLDAGRRLRASERLRGAGREMDNVWIFDRAFAESAAR